MQVSTFIARCHQGCEQQLGALEASIKSGDWPLIRSTLGRFAEAMNRHFRIEENSLFPALERINPQWTVPTEVMRHERAQIRELLDAIDQTAGHRDGRRLADLTTSLCSTVRLHQRKEEDVLFRLADLALGITTARLQVRGS